MTRVAVMGAGSWGSAFASICADAGQDVHLWARRPEVADRINTAHDNPDYLGDLPLHPGVRATAEAGQALRDAEVVVVAVPSHALVDNLRSWRDLVPADAIAVSLVKGIALETRRRASEVITDVLDLPDGHVVVLSGPNLAREVLSRQPSATVVAGPSTAVTDLVQMTCHTPWFRVYTGTDLVGVEVAGAVKNPLAIAAGIADGLGYGDNTKAALITRGLAEMARLGVAVGGDPLTFAGLAGVGDLVATCSSPQSRNRAVGQHLGRGRPLEDIVAGSHMVAEGVRSSRALLAIAEGAGVEMPILHQVVRVLHEGADPRAVGEVLMGRAPTAEFHGLTSDGTTSNGTSADASEDARRPLLPPP